jgi:hypothetical protein
MNIRWLRVFLLLLAILGFGGGTLGFLQSNPEYSILTAMLAALQLFAFNSGVVEGAVPWPLEVARWSAVVFSGSAVAGVVLSFARGGFVRTSLLLQRTPPGRLYRRPLHVVCGLGRKGLNLAQDLHKAKEDVLTIDCNEEMVQAARARHIPALLADGTQDETYEGLPWHRIRRVVFLMGGDHANLLGTLAAQRAAAQQVPGETSPVGRIYTHVPTLSLRNLLFRQDAFKGGEVRLFNYYERLARQILLQYPVEALSVDPDPAGSTGFTEPELGLQGVPVAEEHAPQVFLRPSRDFTPAFVSLLARGSHFPLTARRRWTRIKVFVVDADAEGVVASLQELYPALRRTGDHALIDLEELVPAVGESPAQLIGRRVRGLPPSTPVTVVLDIHDAAKALTEALTVLDEGVPPIEQGSKDAGQAGPPILRCLFDYADEPAIEALIQSDARFRRHIRTLPPLTECCGSGALFQDTADRLARLVHENYDKEGLQPWAGLTLELQESNRAAASHIGLVLRGLGLQREALLAPEFAWPPAVLEALAEAEHRRWSAQKLMDGWRPEPSLGEKQDKARKLHGCLDRTYDELSHAMKDRDRDNLRQIPTLLRALAAQR